MVDYTARIKELEDELRNTKYNKRTQHAIGLLKAKIARIRDRAITTQSKGGKGYSYAVRKSGDASVVLVGFPSVGKSTLLNALTNAKSEIGSYAFTTLDVVPGTMLYKHAQIQILDVPGILKGASIGRGRGREVLSVVRNSDMVLYLIDVLHPNHYSVLKNEVRNSGLRVNEEIPDVKITKKARGGISIGSTVKLTKITKKTINAILREYRINNADVVIRTDIDVDQLIDVIEGSRHYIPGAVVLTKIDSVKKDILDPVKKKLGPDICVSAEKGTNIRKLKELIYKKLDFIRIYCKEVGKKPDLGEPLIMYRGSKISDVCLKLHKDFVKKFKIARVWGKSSKFDGQMLGLKHTVQDKDIVEINIY